MKKLILFSSILFICWSFQACLKNPIRICFGDISLGLPDSLLKDRSSVIEMNGEGLRFFNPNYGDSILLDGTKLPTANIDYNYGISDRISIQVPNRDDKPLGLGKIKILVGLPEDQKAFHCGDFSEEKRFCFESTLTSDKTSARLGEEVTLTGKFGSPDQYRVFFFEGPARASATFRIEDDTRMIIEVPAPKIQNNYQLKDPITIDIYDGENRVCTVQGPEFTYIHTFRGTLIGGTPGQDASSDCDPGTNIKRLYFPRGIDYDESGNLYVANSGNQTILKLPYSITDKTYDAPLLYAGACNQVEKPYCDPAIMNHGSDLSLARFDAPNYLATDRLQVGGNDLYISESTARNGMHLLIRAIRGMSVGNFAGICGSNPSPLHEGDDPRLKGEVSFKDPQGLAVDDDGNLYLADQSLELGSIYRINKSDQLVEHLALVRHPSGLHLDNSTGTPLLLVASISGLTAVDLVRKTTSKKMDSGSGNIADVTGDAAGNFYLVDKRNSELLLFDNNENLRSIEVFDSRGDKISFNGPQGIVYHPEQDRLFVTDTGNHLVWQIDIE